MIQSNLSGKMGPSRHIMRRLFLKSPYLYNRFVPHKKSLLFFFFLGRWSLKSEGANDKKGNFLERIATLREVATLRGNVSLSRHIKTTCSNMFLIKKFYFFPSLAGH